jgi:YVTN family beta-propeller protein
VTSDRAGRAWRGFAIAVAIAVVAADGKLAVQSAAAATLVWVSNEDGGDVVAVDPAAGTVVARIPVGKRPRGIRIAPDGRSLYVALSGSPKAGPGVDESKLPPADRAADGIGVVDIATRRLVKVLPSGQDPEAFDLSPDGKTLYVSNEETAEVTVLDTITGAVKARVRVGEEPEGVTVRPDGAFVYVTCEAENEVAVIDARSLKVVARIATGPRPRSVVFTRDGSVAFVTTENVAAVTVADAARHRALAPLAITSTAGKPLPPRPMGSVLSADGKTVYVSNGRGGSVAVIDVAGRRVTRMIEDVGARPWGIGVSGDGRMVITANGPSGDVSVIDAATGVVVRRIAVGGSPWGIAVGTQR